MSKGHSFEKRHKVGLWSLKARCSRGANVSCVLGKVVQRHHVRVQFLDARASLLLLPVILVTSNLKWSCVLTGCTSLPVWPEIKSSSPFGWGWGLSRAGYLTMEMRPPSFRTASLLAGHGVILHLGKGLVPTLQTPGFLVSLIFSRSQKKGAKQTRTINLCPSVCLLIPTSAHKPTCFPAI